MVIQPPYRNIHRRYEKAIRMRDQIDFLTRAKDDKGTSKKKDDETPVPECVQGESKSDATKSSPDVDTVTLKWPLPPSTLHDGLLFRKVG
ncbi:hypothetical protein J4E86_003335 [Alternaria arbusti]|uniref:uncharacterized protein n=1 Tax=Alternaria arbusti TaxID=232088 RepID=UPI00221F0BC1|nr:uncharacterized protein J4E86_003335 [Alternaria arbusti]KAI4959613.1 hypothetical protein J4E86_003335 [Alternaria arbusti]